MSIEYEDFELEIGAGDGVTFPLSVVHSPAGSSSAQFDFPLGQLELENSLLALQNALLRSGGTRRTVLTREEEAVRDFGRALFAALFRDEIRSYYYESKRSAQVKGKGLRLKLRIAPPQLAALPWEYLFDERDGDYVCLSVTTPLVRFLEVAQPQRPLAVSGPLRVLAMIASPKGLIALNVDVEKQRLERALGSLIEAGQVELTWLAGQSWRDLLREMRPGHGPWHVFHFIGHGIFDPQREEGFLAVADENGDIYPLYASQLGRMLASHRSLRLVILNACEGAQGGKADIFSSAAATLVRRGVPAVVAMQYEITDHAAIEFSHQFYDALADGLPIDTAVAEARKSVSFAINNTLEWGIPVLFMQAPDGVLFDRSAALVEEPAPEAQSVRQSAQVEPDAPLARPRPWRRFVLGSAILLLAAAIGWWMLGGTGGGQIVWPTSAPSPTADAAAIIPPAVSPTSTSAAIQVSETPIVALDDLTESATTTNTLAPAHAPVRPSIKAISLPRNGKSRIEGVAEPGAMVEVSVDDQIAGTTTADAAGQWQLDVQIASPGEHIIEAVTSAGLAVASVLAPEPAPAVADTSTTTPTSTPTQTPTATSTPSPTAPPEAGATMTNPEDGAVYVYVPAGPFIMGSSNDDAYAYQDEKPQQPDVYLDAFWIMQTEVTNAQYAGCVAAGACSEPGNDRWNSQEYAQHPVAGVDWYQANAYAQWVGGRLPTEAEWEKACRGTHGRLYPWGNDPATAESANFNQDVGDTTLAGSYPNGASPYGGLDMAGNVWEWTSSKNIGYPYVFGDGREEMTGDAGRVLRGGSLLDPARLVRCTYRGRNLPNYRNDTYGFRVLSPDAPTGGG